MDNEIYELKTEPEIEDTNARLKLLEEEIEKARARGRAEAKRELWYNHTVDALRTRRDGVRKRIGSVRENSGKAWKDLRNGVDHAVSDLRRAVKDVRLDLHL